MRLLMYRAISFVRKSEGQDLIEYALLVGLISLVAVAALITTGSNVNSIFEAIRDKLAAAT
jgi:Flp pilus assembly pilin Flp